MRYIFVSDIHGRLDKLLKALNDVNFNKDADTIVSVGDAFDRGDQNLEVLEFLMHCPNRILIWGNHDYRLKELIAGAPIGRHDYHNGVLQTMMSFCRNDKITSISTLIEVLRSDIQLQDTYNLLWKYFEECVFAAEWGDLVATHGWLPMQVNREFVETDSDDEVWWNRKVNITYSIAEDWRDSSRDEWIDATWCNTQTAVDNRLFIDKTLLVGHWHSWRLRAAEMSKEEKEKLTLNTIDCSPYIISGKLIAIDGCSNLETGVVNAFVYKNDFDPILIRA